MNNKPHLIVEITPAGSVSIDAKCFTGSNCAKATEQLEVVLGGGGQKTKKRKPEFHAPTATKQTTKQVF